MHAVPRLAPGVAAPAKSRMSSADEINDVDLSDSSSSDDSDLDKLLHDDDGLESIILLLSVKEGGPREATESKATTFVKFVKDPKDKIEAEFALKL
jgi:hypothetical protein